MVNIHNTMRWCILLATALSVICVEIMKPVSNEWEKHSRKVGVKSDRKIERRVAQENGYGAPQGGYGAPEEEVVDLHNKEFCVDVSTFQEVVWVEREGQMCKTNFVKQCSPKSENVCADVTETSCEVSKIISMQKVRDFYFRQGFIITSSFIARNKLSILHAPFACQPSIHLLFTHLPMTLLG